MSRIAPIVGRYRHKESGFLVTAIIFPSGAVQIEQDNFCGIFVTDRETLEDQYERYTPPATGPDWSPQTTHLMGVAEPVTPDPDARYFEGSVD